MLHLFFPAGDFFLHCTVGACAWTLCQCQRRQPTCAVASVCVACCHQSNICLMTQSKSGSVCSVSKREKRYFDVLACIRVPDICRVETTTSSTIWFHPIHFSSFSRFKKNKIPKPNQNKIIKTQFNSLGSELPCRTSKDKRKKN